MPTTMRGPRPEPHGSRTMTVTPTTDSEAGPSTRSPPTSGGETSEVGVLRLRGGPTRQQRVMWTSDTVDNEGMGKKKSKICCIYHKPRRFDESSSESESGSDDDFCCHDKPSEAGGSQRLRDNSHATEVIEQSSESDSDGGGGDGRAKPIRKPRRKHHSHSHSHDNKANKYDAQPRAAGKGKA